MNDKPEKTEPPSRDKLMAALRDELVTIASYNATAHEGAHLTGEGIVLILARAVEEAGFVAPDGAQAPPPELLDADTLKHLAEIDQLDTAVIRAYEAGYAAGKKAHAKTPNPQIGSQEAPFPRPFVLQRDDDVTGVSGTGVVAEGVEFSDGVVALRWVGRTPTSVVFHDNGMDSVRAIHGHDGKTRIVHTASQEGGE